jgi:hypothetical protein
MTTAHVRELHRFDIVLLATLPILSLVSDLRTLFRCYSLKRSDEIVAAIIQSCSNCPSPNYFSCIPHQLSSRTNLHEFKPSLVKSRSRSPSFRLHHVYSAILRAFAYDDPSHMLLCHNDLGRLPNSTRRSRLLPSADTPSNSRVNTTTWSFPDTVF